LNDAVLQQSQPVLKEKENKNSNSPDSVWDGLELNNPDTDTSSIFEKKYKILSAIPSPYEVKDGIRYIRGTLNLVPEKFKILVVDELNNELVFSSISECSRVLKIDRAKIKFCLINGEVYHVHGKFFKFKAGHRYF
jgi:hypothetical protein